MTTRRQLLFDSYLGLGGLALLDLLAADKGRAATTETPNPLKPRPQHHRAKAKSCIFLFMEGGVSQMDTFDPKPDAPAEYRGEFGTMSTAVPGVQLTDMLPRCAAIMEQWSIIRSLYHGDAGHSSGDQICFTGYPAGRNPDENIHPSCGSIVSEQLSHQSPELPAYVMIPRMVPDADRMVDDVAASNCGVPSRKISPR